MITQSQPPLPDEGALGLSNGYALLIRTSFLVVTSCVSKVCCEDCGAEMQDLVVETDPDIIIGYNICNFDLPYLLNRANALHLKDFPYWGRMRRRCIPRLLLSPFGLPEVRLHERVVRH